MTRYLFTITEEMVKNPHKVLGRHWWPLYETMGRLLPLDVGKRVYQVGKIYQVENNEQRDKRVQS